MTTPFKTAIRQLSLATVCVTLVASQSLAGWKDGLLEDGSGPAPAYHPQGQGTLSTQQLARKTFEKFLEYFKSFDAVRKTSPQSVEDEARKYIREAINRRCEDEHVLNFEKETYRRDFKNIREWAPSHKLFSRLDAAFIGDLMKENLITIEECKEALICNAKLAKYLLKIAKAYDEKPYMPRKVKEVVMQKNTVTAADRREYQRWREDYAMAKKAKADFISSLKEDIKNAEK